MNWKPDRTLWRMTLKEFVIIHDGFLIHSWDHTAQLSSLLDGLTSVVINSLSKSKVKPRDPKQMHPFRESKPQGHKITGKSIGLLRQMGDAMARIK